MHLEAIHLDTTGQYLVALRYLLYGRRSKDSQDAEGRIAAQLLSAGGKR
jgi:hypothetical protein